jgi:hypothetical protein
MDTGARGDGLDGRGVEAALGEQFASRRHGTLTERGIARAATAAGRLCHASDGSSHR